MTSSPFIRAARTYLQTFAGLLLAGWVDFASADQFLNLARSAAIAAVPAALSLLQNALEDSTEVQVLPKG
jgi:hypothetical protein